MPLNPKGKKILGSMDKEERKNASKNAGERTFEQIRRHLAKQRTVSG
jgi:hypothetical protein